MLEGQERLRKRGLIARSPANKLSLTIIHEQARYLFAQKYSNWDLQWRSVNFTDESTVKVGKSGIQYVRRKRGERFVKKNVRQQCNRSVAHLNVWAAISYEGISELHVINGALTSRRYIDEILEASQRNFIRNTYGNHEVVFQQDHSPIHTAKIVKNWLIGHHLEVLDWPACSPDVNPIENIWGDMKRQLSLRNDIHNVNDLRNALFMIWNEYSHERQYVVRNAFLSMPRRIQHLINSNGSFIKY